MSHPSDRRRSPRVEVLGRIQGQVASLDIPVRVREISLGGMSIESQDAFEVGGVKDFLLTLGDGAGVELLGKIVYSRPMTEARRNFYVSGIQFVDGGESDSHGPVGGLIDGMR